MKGPTMMKGYLNRPEATAEVLFPNRYPEIPVDFSTFSRPFMPSSAETSLYLWLENELTGYFLMKKYGYVPEDTFKKSL